MSAALSLPAIVDCAPGNTVTLQGSGLIPGAGASVVLGGQGAAGTSTTTIANPTFNTSSVSFVVPDGAVSGPLTVTAGDGSSASTTSLRVGSQYVQATEYLGEGVDTSSLATGELDTILRRASGYADSWIGGTLRQEQTIELHRWLTSRRIYARRRPIISIDGLTIKISNSQFATIQPQDIIVAADLGYCEILSYAVTAYALLGAIQNLGYSANIVALTYTAGYPMLAYPQALRDAVTMIATELLSYRGIQAKGFGGLSSVKQGNQQYDRRSESFAIPQPAKELLRPFMLRRLS